MASAGRGLGRVNRRSSSPRVTLTVSALPAQAPKFSEIHQHAKLRKRTVQCNESPALLALRHRAPRRACDSVNNDQGLQTAPCTQGSQEEYT